MEHEYGQTLFNSENKVYFDLQNPFVIGYWVIVCKNFRKFFFKQKHNYR